MSTNSRCDRQTQRRTTEPLVPHERASETRRRVLVVSPDVKQRTDLAAGLILAGHRVLLARSLDQRASLIGAVHVVVADGYLVNHLGRTTHEALRRAIFIAVCEPGVPTPLAARVRLTPPVNGDDLVTAVVMLASSRAHARRRYPELVADPRLGARRAGHAARRAAGKASGTTP